MKEIYSIHNPYIQKLKKLHQKKYREEEKMYLVEGYHLVNEAYLSHVLKEVYFTRDDLSLHDLSLQDVSLVKVTPPVIETLSQTKTPQSIVGLCEMKEATTITGHHLLLLDRIQDPGNLGTLIRTALGLNMDGIILSPDCVDLYNDKVIRSTQGALFKIPILQKDLNEVMDVLHREGFFIYGTSLKDSLPLKKRTKHSKYALLLGNEGQGVQEHLLNKTNENLRIEMNPLLESFNVAIAGAIFMYTLNQDESF